MTKQADHADIIETLRRNSDGEDTCGHAANLIEWQAKEIRHLALCIHDRDARIKDLTEKLKLAGALT